MKSHLELLSKADEILELARILRTQTIIGFDTEFIRESTFFPIVEIIQVSTESESWLVDAQAFKRNHRAGDPQAFDKALVPLLDVFADPNILKVVHAAQGDQECLFTSFGVVATPTLDTAAAASLCGFGDGIGLGRLLKQVLNVTLMKGHARTNWSARPLPKQLSEYALADVEFLVPLAKSLMDLLDKEGRKTWAFELSAKWENQALYRPDPEGITQKLARGGRLDKTAYAVLSALVQWREDRVRHLNLPRRWVADDHVLLDLARVQPKDLGHLGTFRGLNKGELKNSGETLISVIQKAVKNQDIDYPRIPKPLVPETDELQVLELLRCFVAILADNHKIAAKHLMTTAKLLPLLRSEMQRPEDLEKAGILSGEAARLVGEELIAMIQGKRALLVKGNKVEIMKIED